MASIGRSEICLLDFSIYADKMCIRDSSTEGLYIHGYSVSRLHMGNPLSYFLSNAYHFVANSNPRYCARHRTMLYMKITGADTACLLYTSER